MAAMARRYRDDEGDEIEGEEDEEGDDDERQIARLVLAAAGLRRRRRRRAIGMAGIARRRAEEREAA
jgi:hypothetical protein